MKRSDPAAPERNAPLESSAYDALIGETVNGNFRLVRRLGSGAMGRVFQAEQLSLKKMVAIKLMRNELMADAKLIQRFELEARAASALNHPNVIQIIDCGRDRDYLFIAMELLAGFDLGQLLRREWPIPLHRIARIIDQVLSALDEAHSQGIVHRDLKPGNIMLVPRRGEMEFVKVLDFGIAKAAGGERPNVTMAGLVFGTPEYMSPEQARGHEVDGRTDLYAVATLLYELIVGEIPFASASPVDVMARQLSEVPVAPSQRNLFIPPALEDLIMRGLAKKPSERPQSAAEFQVQLRQALIGVVDQWPTHPGTLPPSTLAPLSAAAVAAAVATPSGGASPASAPPVARKRSARALLVGAAIVLAFAAGTTAYVATRRSARPGNGSPPATAQPAAGPSLARPSMLARPPAAAPPVDDDATTNSENEEAAARGAGPHVIGPRRRR